MLNEAIFRTNFFSRGGLDSFGNIKWSICPGFFWGAPGTGKTGIGNTLAKVYDCDFVHSINLADNGPAEIGGAMYPDPSGNYFVRLPPKWVWDANNAKRALVIFDEFGDAPALMQSIAQKVLNERIVGDTKLKGHVRFACFGNPPDMSTNAYETGMAVANRGAHFELQDSPEFLNQWCRWLIEDAGEVFEPKKLDADGLEKDVSKNFQTDLANAVGTIVAFAQFRAKNPSLEGTAYPSAGIMNVPSPEDLRARSRAWSSYRTCTFMTRWLAASHRHGLSELDTDRGIEALIGPGMLKEFSAWRFERKDLPRIEDVLDGVVQWKHDRTRPDITLSVLSGGTAVAMSSKTRKKERVKKLWSIMKEVASKEPDLCYLAAESLETLKIPCEDRDRVLIELWDADEVIRAS